MNQVPLLLLLIWRLQPLLINRHRFICGVQQQHSPVAWQVPEQTILPPMDWQQHELTILPAKLYVSAVPAAKAAVAMVIAPSVASAFLKLAVILMPKHKLSPF